MFFVLTKKQFIVGSHKALDAISIFQKIRELPVEPIFVPPTLLPFTNFLLHLSNIVQHSRAVVVNILTTTLIVNIFVHNSLSFL
jgi:hypothetical protein